MSVNLERFHGRLLDRRAFLQEAGASAAGLGAAAAGLLSLPDLRITPEKPVINESGSDQFCIQNPG